MTPQDRARRSADAMWAGDHASQSTGMAITNIGPGQATMTIRPDISNGHGAAHGGFLFTLADSAFAFACNSYNNNVVGQHTSMTYLSPGRVGEVITATATETSRAGQPDVFDVTLSGEDGRQIALFRDHSRQISGHHFDEDTAAKTWTQLKSRPVMKSPPFS